MKICAISDQHGHIGFTTPACDLLVVAGDQCPDVFGGIPARLDPRRQRRWFEDTWLPWRYAQPAGTCVVTWGNHDYCGEVWPGMMHQHDGKTTVVATDQEVTVCGLRVYLTPWSNTFMQWAFMRDPEVLVGVYAQIPTGLDLLVSHQPPMGYGSECTNLDFHTGKISTTQIGSEELLAAITRARPRAVVCGHIHSGHGSFDCDGVKVYNVSVVDEGYRLVHAPTEFEL